MIPTPLPSRAAPPPLHGRRRATQWSSLSRGLRWALAWLLGLAAATAVAAGAPHGPPVQAAAAATAAAAAPVMLADLPSLTITPNLQVYRDAERSRTADDLLSAEGLAAFRPLGSGFAAANFGRTRAAMWFTTVIRREPGSPATWLLDVGQPSMDRVEVWWQFPDGRRVHQVSGDLVAQADRPMAHRSLIFPVTLPEGGEVRLLIRLESTGTVSARSALWQPAALAKQDQWAYAALGLYFGLIGALLLYNLMLYASLRESTYLVYVGFVASMTLSQLSVSGFGHQFVWPGSPTWSHLSMSFGFGLAGILSAQFVRQLLGTPQRMPRADRLLRFQMALFVPVLVATPVYTLEAGVLMNLAGAFSAVLALGVCVVAAQRGDRRARFFLLAGSMLFAAVGIVVGHAAGWLPSNVVTIHAMQFGSALEMLLLSFSLAERIQMDRHAREAAQAQALAAGRAMLDQARESERLLESRVHERTAALARANEQLRRSEAELRRLAHHDPLTGLPNRKLFLDRLDHAIDRARRQGTAFAVLSLDLDGFKLVNDRHGHAAGDELLVAIAARLTATLRASDTVARWGGDEFVLILEDLSDPHTAQPPVAKLTALVEEPVSLRSGAVVRVGVSIGVASFPGDGDRAEVLLEQADQAMYARKDESRRRAA